MKYRIISVYSNGNIKYSIEKSQFPFFWETAVYVGDRRAEYNSVEEAEEDIRVIKKVGKVVKKL